MSNDDAVRRSLELLWGVEQAPRRGRKPRVTPAEVVTAAVIIADRDGLDAVSMRKVAEEIGVTAMAVYSYVPNKAVLVDAMVDHVVAALTHRHPPAGTWRAQLAWSAHQSWAAYSQHPWALPIVMVRRPFGPNLLAALEANLSIVADLGLTTEEMIGVIDTVDHYVHGALAATLDIQRSESDSGITNREWFDRHGRLLDQFADFGNYPTLASLWESGHLTEHQTDFDFGLQRVLDGIEHYIATENRARETKLPGD